MKTFDFPQLGRSVEAETYEEACDIVAGKKPVKKTKTKKSKKEI